VLEHAFILCRQDIITAEHLPPNYRCITEDRSTSHDSAVDRESRTILQALEKTAWNKARAARLLGFDRKTLYRKIWKMKIKKDND
jgi:transcriptional regulator of acetoin/glycerol metabolism